MLSFLINQGDAKEFVTALSVCGLVQRMNMISISCFKELLLLCLSSLFF